jgi:hypothetical protein
MASPARIALLFSALLCASCDRSAISPSQSLVGAKSLPSASELSKEAIEINKGFGDISLGFLSYELKPDNSLTVTLTARNREVIVGKDEFHLSANIAADARRMLWQVRPEKLEGIDWETRPIACHRQYDHDFGELAVVFRSDEPKAGSSHSRIGVFVLPGLDSCRSLAAMQARKLLERVIQSFPPSKLPSEFERRNARLDKVIVPL